MNRVQFFRPHQRMYMIAKIVAQMVRRPNLCDVVCTVQI